MKLEDTFCELIDWEKIEKTEIKGAEGFAFWKTKKFPGTRIRMIEKSPGYRADHYCLKGHILYMLEGEMEIYFENGDKFIAQAGQTIYFGDTDKNGHCTYTENGAKYFIID